MGTLTFMLFVNLISGQNSTKCEFKQWKEHVNHYIGTRGQK